jgi:hypothetical protein
MPTIDEFLDAGPSVSADDFLDEKEASPSAPSTENITGPSIGDISSQPRFEAPFAPGMPYGQAPTATLTGPWYEGLPWTQEGAVGVLSTAGITPEAIPSGQRLTDMMLGVSPQFGAISRQAFPVMKALDIPTTLGSSFAKTGIGLGEYLSSPQGTTELVLSMSPAKLLIFSKWALDMAEGTYSEGKAFKELLNKQSKTPEDWQAISDHAVNVGAMALGAIGAGKSARKAFSEIKPIESKQIPIEPRFDVAQVIENRFQAELAAQAGSPFMRMEPPPQQGPVSMGFRSQPPLGLTAELEPAVMPGISMKGTPVEFSPTVSLRETFDPSGLRMLEVPQEVQTQFQGVQPPAPPMGPGPRPVSATTKIRLQGEAVQRLADWEKAMAEKVAQDQSARLHPDKPLTENQLRIIRESLTNRILEGQIPGERPGIISGSALEKWADKTLSDESWRKDASMNPFGAASKAGKNTAAFVVKGAALLERGIVDAAKWSAEMVKEFGESIQPFLQSIRSQSEQVRLALQKGGEENALQREATPVLRSMSESEVPQAIEKPVPSSEGGAKIVEARPEVKPPPLRPDPPVPESQFPVLPKEGVEIVTIRRRDGTMYRAALDPMRWPKEVLAPGMTGELVHRVTLDTKGTPYWSSGMLDPGETIVGKSTKGGVERGLQEKGKEKEVTQLAAVGENMWYHDATRATQDVLNSGELRGGYQSQASLGEPFTKPPKKTGEVDILFSSTRAATRGTVNEATGLTTAWIPPSKLSDSHIDIIARDSGGRTVSVKDAYLAGERNADALKQIGRQRLSTETPLKSELTKKLESLKFPETGEGRVYSLPHPDAIKAIGRSTWNSAIDLAISAIKAGKAIGEAIDIALSHIRKNAPNFDEVKARANLEFVARSETPALPTQPSATTAAAPAGQPPRGATLEDVYHRFEPVTKTGTPFKQAAVNVAEAVRTGMASKFRPIDKLSEDIAKAYGTSTPSRISGIFEQLKGSTGRGEADIYRFDRDVSSLVKGSERDFNAYMFLRRSLDRMRQDLADIQTAQAGGEVGKLNRRKVSGYTIPELESKLSLLESNLGAEKVAQFQRAADLYQQHMDSALRLQVESGRMSPEVYQAIKDGNQFYAPFKVMKYFEEIAKPEGTGRKIDTVADYTKAMEGIEDPNFRLVDMLGAARQNILLSRILADKNNAMRRLTQLADFDPDGLFIRKLRTGQEAPQGMNPVNVKENGQTSRYAVNKDVADAVQASTGVADNVLVQVMGYAAIPMKAGATSLNIPFQVSNLLADVPRQALVSRYGISSAADLVRYPMDFARALYSSIAGDVFKSDNKIFLDFLDSGAAGSTIQEYLTPSALRFKPSTLQTKSKTFAKTVLFALPDFAKAIEQTSKVMGVQRAMRAHGVESGKALAQTFPEAITEIRRFSGSPDFGRQGKWVEQSRLNLLYMFFNARLQGALADLGRLAGRDGKRIAATTWIKLGAAVGIPTMYLYALNHRNEYADDYKNRPEQERQNYWLVPKDSYITNERGEKMRDYWRIPKRESAKWMANFIESALDFHGKRDPEQLGRWMEAALVDISPLNIKGETLTERMESMGASLNPVMKAPIELATGRDLFRHREIVPESMRKASPEQQFIERTPEVFKVLANAIPDVAPEVFRSPMMLENMVRNFTAGMVTQFLPRKPIEGRQGLENNPLLQRFQAVPYTDSSEFENRMKFLEREAADEQVQRYRNAKAILDTNKNKPIQESIKQAVEKYGPDQKLLTRMVDLYLADQRGITNEERRILALPVEQRAQFIAQELKGATPEQKAQLILDYAQKRILTEQVGAELAKLLAAAPAPPQ